MRVARGENHACPRILYSPGVELTSLHQRLRAAAGDRSFRHLADVTGTSAESVRRYMAGHAPSAEFLSGLCAGLGLNGEWLLTGRGPMRAAEVRTRALREANASELLNAMATTLERLIDRVERIEVFVQTMETRLRARAHGDGDDATRANFSVRGGAQSIADAISGGESR